VAVGSVQDRPSLGRIDRLDRDGRKVSGDGIRRVSRDQLVNELSVLADVAPQDPGRLQSTTDLVDRLPGVDPRPPSKLIVVQREGAQAKRVEDPLTVRRLHGPALLRR
jgi:hypothetical protein